MNAKSFVFFTLLLASAGCGRPNTASPNESAPRRKPTQVHTETTDNNVSIDLSIPKFPPQPVVWLDDLEGGTTLPVERREARHIMRTADRMKAEQEYVDAEQIYKQAIAKDPLWAYPHYQLACNYELWGKRDLAENSFSQAMDLGFADFFMAISDDELGHIRHLPRFSDDLQKIRERYLSEAVDAVGQPIAVRPIAERPSSGWPMILLLHGYGDTNLSYVDNATAWAGLGFVAVAVPGSVPMSFGRFQWDYDSIEPTHKDLKQVVESSMFDGLVDRNKVFLLGFSQGALHSLLLTAKYPKDYAGVVALSPAGSLAQQLLKPQITRSESTRCVMIYGEQENSVGVIPLWNRAARNANWQFEGLVHRGGHHFPQDWSAALPRIANFLLGSDEIRLEASTQ